MKKVKAYLVRVDDDEGSATIAFATSNAAARRKGGNELDAAFDEVESCRRAPEFDEFAPGPVPPLVMIEHGWYFECHNCGTSIRDDSEDEDGEPHSPVAMGQEVYCCAACQAERMAKWRARKAAEVALVELVTTRYPEAKVNRVHVYGDKLEPSDPHGGIRCGAYLQLPGLKSDVHFIFGADHVMVAQQDVEAFNTRYASSSSVPNPPKGGAGECLEGM